MDNYFQVKQDVKDIIETEVARLKRERRELKSDKQNNENEYEKILILLLYPVAPSIIVEALKRCKGFPPTAGKNRIFAGH